MFIFNDCKRLAGYQFPVYSTSFCPKNEIEWNKRSSAINCTSSNGYICLPNENFTELLEFCYIEPKIWIPKGYCLYLVKHESKLNTYNCSHFKYGCHNSSYLSTRIFENPACMSIGYGCFLAEPSCKRTPTPINPSNAKDDWVWIVALVCAFSLILIVFSIPFIKRFCHKKTDDFSYDIHHAYDEIDSIIDESEDDKMNPTSRDKLLVKTNLKKDNLPKSGENFCMEDGASAYYIDSSKEVTSHSFNSCQNGHGSTVQQLLDNAAEINAIVDDGNNPLYIACENRDYDCVRLLLSKGANANLCLEDGSSPLFEFVMMVLMILFNFCLKITLTLICA